jgi:DNA modification methylase
LERALGRGEPGDARPIAGDGPEANSLVKWFFAEAARLLRHGSCCCCCCGGGGPDPQFARWALWMDEHLAFKQMIVWDKGKMGLGWHYRRSYETILVAQKGGGKCRWFDETKRVENVIRPGDYGIRKIIPRKSDHPTPKPVELSAHFIGLHSRPGDVVLDPFMGGGSTGVAAVDLGRGFVGVELDERWFDIARRRISEAVERRDAGAA